MVTWDVLPNIMVIGGREDVTVVHCGGEMGGGEVGWGGVVLVS